MNIVHDFETNIKPTWCPGCGNFGIWASLKGALTQCKIASHDAVVVYGVGCHGNMVDWMRVYGVRGLHGRALPLAQGLKLANPNLSVICVVGDGDCLGEGGNHFIHAAKRNPNITVIIHNNGVYALTTGQASPTAQTGFRTKSTPEGVVDEPVNPLGLAIISGATFAARGFAGDIPSLTDIIARAIAHKGFSVVDVLQPCVTFDKVHTYQWYQERIYKVEGNDGGKSNREHALIRSLEWGDKIPTGVFYQVSKPTSEEREAAGSLIRKTGKRVDISAMLTAFT